MPEEHGSDQAGSESPADSDTHRGVGSVLADRYELGELLGQGGMAAVYRGFDRLLGRSVAVKVLREDAGDETALARFNSEARMLAGLSHRRLVLVLDAGFTSHRPFLVMELVEGPTLAQVIARGPVDVERVGSVGVQLAEGLAYAHGAGVVHRDVKPGNVLLGGDGHVKLADFGIARLIGDTVRHTQTGMAIGTAAYLAPEQVQGQDVTGAADVYSLALVLLEAVTGERAFPGTPTESALARLHRRPKIPNELPEEWRTLLTRMTALDPEARPPADEVAAELRIQPTIVIPAVQATPVNRSDSAQSSPDATLLLSQAEPAVSRSAHTQAEPAVSQSALTQTEPAVSQFAHTRAVAAVLVVLLAFLVVVAIAAGTGSQNQAVELPDQIPRELEEPLRDLHEAVNQR